jgi:hypothetical protein
MGLRKGLPVKLGMTDADDTRYDFRNLVVCNADGSARGGVTSPVGVPLLSWTATMNVAVAVFNGVAARDGGAVLLSNDGVANVLLDPAPSSQSRLDVIFAKQNDSSSTVSVPDSDDLPDFGVLKGEASPNPVRNPAGLPDGALEIGTVLVPSTATTTSSPDVVITTTCPYTAAPGGSVPFRSFAELQAWTAAGPNQKANVFADADASKNGDYVAANGWARSLPSVPLLVARDLGGNTWTNQTQWANFPNSPDANAFAKTFVKTTTGSKLIISAYMTVALTSGVAQNPSVGVNIDGTDYDVDTTAVATAPSYGKLYGTIEIPGLPAGNHAITLRFKTSTASTMVGQNRAGYSVMETF